MKDFREWVVFVIVLIGILSVGYLIVVDNRNDDNDDNDDVDISYNTYVDEMKLFIVFHEDNIVPDTLHLPYADVFKIKEMKGTEYWEYAPIDTNHAYKYIIKVNGKSRILKVRRK